MEPTSEEDGAFNWLWMHTDLRSTSVDHDATPVIFPRANLASVARFHDNSCQAPLPIACLNRISADFSHFLIRPLPFPLILAKRRFKPPLLACKPNFR